MEFKSVELWHCLPVHPEREALFADFPCLKKIGYSTNHTIATITDHIARKFTWSCPWMHLQLNQLHTGQTMSLVNWPFTGHAERRVSHSFLHNLTTHTYHRIQSSKNINRIFITVSISSFGKAWDNACVIRPNSAWLRKFGIGRTSPKWDVFWRWRLISTINVADTHNSTIWRFNDIGNGVLFVQICAVLCYVKKNKRMAIVTLQRDWQPFSLFTHDFFPYTLEGAQYELSCIVFQLQRWPTFSRCT